MKTLELTHEMNKLHAGPPPEGMGIDKPCKNYHQKDNKRVIPDKLKENKITSVQRANKKSQCSSKSKKTEKQSQGVEVDIKLETIVHSDHLNEKTNTSDISISANELPKENIKSDQGANDESSQCSSKEKTVKIQEMSVGDEDNNNDDGHKMSHGDSIQRNVLCEGCLEMTLSWGNEFVFQKCYKYFIYNYLGTLIMNLKGYKLLILFYILFPQIYIYICLLRIVIG